MSSSNCDTLSELENTRPPPSAGSHFRAPVLLGLCNCDLIGAASISDHHDSDVIALWCVECLLVLLTG